MCTRWAREKLFAWSSHTLLVGANDFAFSYLKMLDAFDIDRTNIVAILDQNPRLFGRALLSHPHNWSTIRNCTGR